MDAILTFRDYAPQDPLQMNTLELEPLPFGVVLNTHGLLALGRLNDFNLFILLQLTWLILQFQVNDVITSRGENL